MKERNHMSNKRCPSCGAAIDWNAVECKYCGESILDVRQQPPQPPPQPQPQSQPQETYTNKESTYLGFEYLKPYYQEEFQKIRASNGQYKGKWNWAAFFLSWIWAFTKGLWGPALVTIGIAILFGSIDSTLSGIISLALWIFWGLRGNYLYYNLITTKKQFARN